MVSLEEKNCNKAHCYVFNVYIVHLLSTWSDCLGGEDKEENNKKKNGRVVEKNEELSVLTLLNKYLIKPFLPQ